MTSDELQQVQSFVKAFCYWYIKNKVLIKIQVASITKIIKQNKRVESSVPLKDIGYDKLRIRTQ